jgi:septal ring-binding cell division protein DamX
MLPSPWLILGVVFALLGVYGYGHHEGYKEKSDEDAAVIASKNEEMNQAKEKHDVELNKAKQALVTKNKQYVDAIHDGSLRLSIPVSSQVVCSSSTSGDGQARVELDGSVSEALIAIAGEGDQAIIELNSCIDRYNSVREITSGNK